MKPASIGSGVVCADGGSLWPQRSRRGLAVGKTFKAAFLAAIGAQLALASGAFAADISGKPAQPPAKRAFAIKPVALIPADRRPWKFSLDLSTRTGPDPWSVEVKGPKFFRLFIKTQKFAALRFLQVPVLARRGVLFRGSALTVGFSFRKVP